MEIIAPAATDLTHVRHQHFLLEICSCHAIVQKATVCVCLAFILLDMHCKIFWKGQGTKAALHFRMWYKIALHNVHAAWPLKLSCLSSTTETPYLQADSKFFDAFEDDFDESDMKAAWNGSQLLRLPDSWRAYQTLHSSLPDAANCFKPSQELENMEAR